MEKNGVNSSVGSVATTTNPSSSTGIGEILIDRYNYSARHMKNVVIPTITRFFENQEHALFEVLLREIAITLKKQKISFQYFCKLFSVIKFAVSKQCAAKKDNAANNRFGEAVIVLGSVYLPSQPAYSSTAIISSAFQSVNYPSHRIMQTSPSQISAQHRKRFRKIKNLLSFVDSQTIKLRLEKCLSINAYSPAFQVCLSILLSRNKLATTTTTPTEAVASATAIILPKLIEEFLVDSRKRDPSKHFLAITPLIAELIDAECLSSVILPKLAMLLKRSEDNIDSTIAVLSMLKQNDASYYDTSLLAADFVLLHLKPYYFPLNGSNNASIPAAMQVIYRIKAVSVLLTVTEGIAAMIAATNDERRKISLFPLFKAVVSALSFIQDDALIEVKQQIQMRIAQCICENISTVQTPESLEMFSVLIEEYFNSLIPKEFTREELVPFSSELGVILKKKLVQASASNVPAGKVVITAACMFVRKCIGCIARNENRIADKSEGSEGMKKAITTSASRLIVEGSIKEVIEGICAAGFSPIVKAPTKLVTNTESFLASLEVIASAANTLAFHAIPSVELMKKSLKSIIFSDKTATNKREFLSKISQLESQLFFGSLLEIAACLQGITPSSETSSVSSTSSTILGDLSTLITFSNSFVHLLFACPFKGASNLELLKQTIKYNQCNLGAPTEISKMEEESTTESAKELLWKKKKQSKIVVIGEILTFGIYWTLKLLFDTLDYQSYNIQNVKKSIELLRVIIEALDASDVALHIAHAEFLPWIFSHPIAADTHSQVKFKQMIKNRSDFNELFRVILSKSTFANPLVFLSDHMLQHPLLSIRKTANAYIRFVFDLIPDAVDLLLRYRVAFQWKNFEVKHAKIIEGFELDIIKLSDEIDLSIHAVSIVLSSLEFSTVMYGCTSSTAVVSSAASYSVSQQKKQSVAALATSLAQSKKLFQPYIAGTGHSFLDDEELQMKRKDELSQRMLHYFRLSYEVLFLFYAVKCDLERNIDEEESKGILRIAMFFFDNFNEVFYELSSEKKEVSFEYAQILAKVLSLYEVSAIGVASASSRVLRKKKKVNQISEFVRMVAIREKMSEKSMKEYSGFLLRFNEFIRNHDASLGKSKHASVIRFLHVINMEILLACESGSLEFNFDLVSQVLTFYVKLPSEFEELVRSVYETVSASIDQLSLLSVTEELLVKVLGLRKSVVLLFKQILRVSSAAKKCVLSVMLELEKIKKGSYALRFDEIVKLRVLALDSQEELRVLAINVLETVKQDVTTESVNAFDFVTFVADHSLDVLDKFTTISQDFTSIKPDLHKLIFKKVIEGAEVLCMRNLPQEVLSFFPKYLSRHRSTITPDILMPIFNLLVDRFCNPASTQMMDLSMQCGIDLIKRFGSTHMVQIVAIFDRHLKSNSSEDVHKQLAAIVFLGVCAPYIKNKGLLETVSSKILILFKNGTENLQRSLAKCLPDLMNFFENPKLLIETTLSKLTTDSLSQQKKGHAYLIAGLLKGLGVGFIDKLGIFSHIDDDLSTEGRKDGTSKKESILILITCLLDVFGRVFEPYTPRTIKVLMHFFAESNDQIKDLAISASKLLMSSLTGYGVKMILPRFLDGLEDQSWRVKYNSIWGLGSLASCSPNQMSECLPSIVPRLSACFSDTHPKIREIAKQSLTMIGSSVKIPEISAIVDRLIAALADPFDLNREALHTLLHTRFLHYMDAPSLALVVPIIDYALTQKRDIKSKEHACCVVGNLSHLIQKSDDMLPYIDLLVRGLKNAISDHDIGVRTFASKAIGSLCRTLRDQEEHVKFFDFVKEILESKSASVLERSGAAQAFAEIISTQGIPLFEEYLSTILSIIHTRSSSSYMREGYLGVFVFVPGILKEAFYPFIGEILELVSEFVSDEDERTRETALRVLSTFIHIFGETQTQLLTDHINEGLFSTNWRRRITSVILSQEIQDTLHKLIRSEQINERIAKQHSQQLQKQLHLKEQRIQQQQQQSQEGQGQGIHGRFNLPVLEKCNSSSIAAVKQSGVESVNQQLSFSNLMGVYILNEDDSEKVQMQAVTLWKTCVEESPKTLKTGLRSLIEKMITAMCAGSPVDSIARTSMTSFCKKHGEGLFPAALKHFSEILSEQSTESNGSRLRGAVLVLSEYCKNMSGTTLRGNSINLSSSSSGMYTSNSGSGFEELLVNMLDTHIDSDDALLRRSVVTAMQVITEKTQELGLFQHILDRLLDQFISNPLDNHPVYLKTFNTLSLICAAKSNLFTKYIIHATFQRPIRVPCIELLTNNAEHLAKVLYSLLPNKQILFSFYSIQRCGIEILFEEIFDSSVSDSHREALIYAMCNLTVNLSSEDIVIFLKSMTERISTLSKAYCHYSEDAEHLGIVLRVLKFYMLKNTNKQSHSLEFYKELITLVTPFVFETKYAAIVLNAVPILRAVFSFINRSMFVGLISTFTLAIEDALASKEKSEKLYEIVGFNTGDVPGDGVRSFVELATNCIVYSPDSAFTESADLFNYIIRYTNVINLEEIGNKLVGPMIRVAHYKLELIEKERVLRLFLQLFSKPIDLSGFVPQLMTTFLKIAVDYPPQSKNYQRLIAENLLEVILLSPRKDLALHAIYSRSRVYPDSPQHTEVYLYAVWKLLKANFTMHDETLFSKVLLEKILSQSFDLTLAISMPASTSLATIDTVAAAASTNTNHSIRSLSEIEVNAKIIGLLSHLVTVKSLESTLGELIVETVRVVPADLNLIYLNLSKILAVVLSCENLEVIQYQPQLRKMIEIALQRLNGNSKEYLLKRIKRIVRMRKKNDVIRQFFLGFCPPDFSKKRHRNDHNVCDSSSDNYEEDSSAGSSCSDNESDASNSEEDTENHNGHSSSSSGNSCAESDGAEFELRNVNDSDG